METLLLNNTYYFTQFQLPFFFFCNTKFSKMEYGTPITLYTNHHSIQTKYKRNFCNVNCNRLGINLTSYTISLKVRSSSFSQKQLKVAHDRTEWVNA